MLARCARCQNTFTTDRFGVQTCPHCGSEVLLSDPNAPTASPTEPSRPPSAPSSTAPPAGAQPPAGAPPPAGEGQPPPGPGGPVWGAPPPPPGPPPPGWGTPPGGGWRPPPGPPPPEQSAPFARRREIGVARAWLETFRLAAFDPSAFFRSVKLGESGSAVLFGVIAVTLAQWFEAAFGYFTSFAWQGWVEEMMRRLPPGSEGTLLRLYVSGSAAAFLARVVAAPIYAAVVIFVIAGIVHVFLALFRGAGRGFDATLTAVGYAAGLEVLGILPLCGAVVGLIWFAVVLIIGLGEIQRCGPGKAAAATLLPGALVCACCCGSLGALLSAIPGLGRHPVTI